MIEQTTKLPDSNQNFYAFVMGIDKFDIESVRNLQGCVNDAVEICSFLVHQVKIPPGNIKLLLSPMLGPSKAVPGLPEGVTFSDARTATIQAAFEALIQRVQKDDHVVVYYATHGARYESPNGEWSYLMFPQDYESRNWRKMIPTAQLNHYLRKLTENASVSVIADTCHSASSTRGADEEQGGRGIKLDVATPEEWAEFKAAHGSFEDLVGTETVKSGTGLGDPGQKEWVLFAACKESEIAQEYPSKAANHGLFTAMLLKELRAPRSEPIHTLRWMQIEQAVKTSLATAWKQEGYKTPQTPALQGRDDSTLFGGKWVPFDPGYTVTADGDGSLRVDAGVPHGLDVGAVIELFPPGTASFASATATGQAVILQAGPTQSTGKLQTGDPPKAKTRARLIVPSQNTPKLRVQVPDELAATGVLQAQGVIDVLELVDKAQPAEFVVRPWVDNQGQDRSVHHPERPHDKGGYVLVSTTAGTGQLKDTELFPDDVIAYLPPVSDKYEAKAIAAALGYGLVSWAGYQRILRQTHSSRELANLVKTEVFIGSKEDLETMKFGGPVPAKMAQPDASGTYQIQEDDYLLLRLQVSSWTARGWKLSMGVVCCSNDGNISALWPPPGDEPDLEHDGDGKPITRQAIWVGNSKQSPIRLIRREDQNSSLCVFKVYAATVRSGEKFSKDALEIKSDVQQVLNESLRSGRGGPADEGAAPAPQFPLWYTWDLPFVISKVG